MFSPRSVISGTEGRSRKKSAKLRKELAQLLSAAAGNGTHAGKRSRTKTNQLFSEVASGLAKKAPRKLQLMYEVEYDVDATVQHMIDSLRTGFPDSFGQIDGKNIFENATSSGRTLATPYALLVALGRARVGPVHSKHDGKALLNALRESFELRVFFLLNKRIRIRCSTPGSRAYRLRA